MNEGLDNNQSTTEQAIKLTPQQSIEFRKNIKIGIYKELHRKGLLTDVQLKQLIRIQGI